MLRRIARLGILLLAVALMAYTGTTSFSSNNQLLAHGDIAALVSAGQLRYQSSPPNWSTSDSQVATCGEFVAYVQVNTTCAALYGTLSASAAGARDISWGEAQSIRVLAYAHSPLLSNNSFQTGTYQSWTLNTNSCSSSFSMGVSTTDTDGDGHGSTMTAAGDLGGANGCTESIAQTFSLPATPTSTSITFWYQGNAPLGTDTSGGVCSPQDGSATAYVNVNGTNYSTTVANDGSWHSYTFNNIPLNSGNNTVTVYQKAQTAVNQTLFVDQKTQVDTCKNTYSAASATVDDVIVSGTY